MKKDENFLRTVRKMKNELKGYKSISAKEIMMPIKSFLLKECQTRKRYLVDASYAPPFFLWVIHESKQQLAMDSTRGTTQNFWQLLFSPKTHTIHEQQNEVFVVRVQIKVKECISSLKKRFEVKKQSNSWKTKVRNIKKEHPHMNTHVYSSQTLSLNGFLGGLHHQEKQTIEPKK